MRWTIGKTEAECFVRIALEGEFSTDKFYEIFGELFGRADWKLGMHILFDETNLSLIDTTYEIVRHASQCYAEQHYHIGEGKIALLMKSVADFGRGRQFEMLTEMKIPANIRIFMTEAEAINWLLDSSIGLPHTN